MMEWIESLPTGQVSVLIGALTDLAFGALAQQSRFCLRAACVEFWRGDAGPKFAIWLLAFASALIATQLLILNGTLETTSIRQLTTTGSLSGAIIGGSLFGWGMVMARGCASRLLVLSGTGNQRALVAGLVVTLVSQATLRGGLSPLREWAGGLWLVDASARNLADRLPTWLPLIAGIALLAGGIYLARVHANRLWPSLAAVGVGLCIALGWGLTAWHASWSFDIIAVKSVSFTGPSADTLMGFINLPQLPLSFDIGIVVGVFAGAMLAAVASGQFKLQSFTEQTGLSRYLIGAGLMGFGGMLAGGCAVGAGVTGGAVMALTAWVALLFMWLNAGIADWVLERAPRPLEVAGPAPTAD
ncbi:YeeE/YedE family protein [Litorivicinus lipolyticus]|uniref:YeeE/YedE family protein n=2 Tax=Litorivicinus lipolyticus TaxID=418701 RepID=A0A5Q2Q559_9GAMM|nr:YeeE/YedE family protein [Litorivicinus lipolyticus]